jgi:hypothetical protein
MASAARTTRPQHVDGQLQDPQSSKWPFSTDLQAGWKMVTHRGWDERLLSLVLPLLGLRKLLLRLVLLLARLLLVLAQEVLAALQLQVYLARLLWRREGRVLLLFRLLERLLPAKRASAAPGVVRDPATALRPFYNVYLSTFFLI